MFYYIAVFILFIFNLSISSCTFSSPFPAPKLSAECVNIGTLPHQYCVTPEFSGGRLGNQLFEVATALAIAKDNNCTAVFPMFTEESTWNKMATYGFPAEKLFLPYLDDNTDAIFSHQRLGKSRDASRLECFVNTVAENSLTTRDQFLQKARNNLPVRIRGASVPEMVTGQLFVRDTDWGFFKFFSYQLFDHHRNYIQNTLGPTNIQRLAIMNKLEPFGLQIKNKTTCSIHIRRGDREEWRWKLVYPMANMQYYRNAIEKMEHQLKVENKKPIDTYIVISDDIEYAKNTLQEANPKNYAAGKFFFVDYKKHQQKDYEDLWLASMTNHNIISNSTFSYWGAYLNKNTHKLVVQPNTWLGPGLKLFFLTTSNNGISPPEWITVDDS
ncbi:MAG: alpha-1,2-fucosyltransferase [bacterium]|nr:alpha-1,2-fucosyltransferase [bacterium]